MLEDLQLNQWVIEQSMIAVIIHFNVLLFSLFFRQFSSLFKFPLCNGMQIIHWSVKRSIEYSPELFHLKIMRIRKITGIALKQYKLCYTTVEGKIWNNQQSTINPYNFWIFVNRLLATSKFKSNKRITQHEIECYSRCSYSVHLPS